MKYFFSNDINSEVNNFIVKQIKHTKLTVYTYKLNSKFCFYSFMYKLLYTTKNAFLRINNILKNNTSSWHLNDTIKTTLKCFDFSLFFIRIENNTFISEKFLKISEIYWFQKLWKIRERFSILRVTRMRLHLRKIFFRYSFLFS